MINGPSSSPLRAVLTALLLALGSFCGAARADIVQKDGKVHVTYWEKWVSFEGIAMQATIDAFNRTHPGIVVEYYPTSQIDRKTLVATAGGDPPDVAGLWVQNIATFADAEALLPLDPFIRRDGLTNEQWLARYYPIFAQICQYRGHVYAGISTPAVIGFAWNRTLFRAAGLDPDRPPRDLAELADYSKRLTRRDAAGHLVQAGFIPQEPGWWPWAFARWFGGELFDGQSITCGTDPHVLEMFRWVASYSREYGAAELQTFTSGFAGQMLSAQSAFMNSKVAMVCTGVWMDNYMRQYKPGLDWRVGAWPEAAPGIKDFCMAEADVLVIPRGARNPDAAWEFIKYCNSNNPKAQSREELEGSELACFLQAKTSPLRVWSPYFEQHHPNRFAGIFRKLSASPHAVCVPQMGIWQEYHREFTAAFQQVRILGQTPEEAARYCQERMSRSWERYLRSLQRHGQGAPTDRPAAAPAAATGEPSAPAPTVSATP